MTKDFTESELDQAQKKARSRGTFPALPDATDAILTWVTTVWRPAPGFVFDAFDRAGRQRTDPCTISFRNGRETRTFRFAHQADLHGPSLRRSVLAATDGWCRMPHLNTSEIEDVWAALCILSRVLSEADERDETRKWMQQLVRGAMPFGDRTLVPDGVHDALMTLRRMHEFVRVDALAFPIGVHRPVRFIDKHTRDQWVRSRETATFIRWVCGVEPLSHSTLEARLVEIGIIGKLFESRLKPHPKLILFQLTNELIEETEGLNKESEA